jgi:uncharacterized 2Fe-2S/4Fe-4S cluster protein (DUF4445 family)
VDTVAQLLKYGMLENSGKLKSRKEVLPHVPEKLKSGLIEYRGQRAFLLDESSGVLITQQDIRELQLALSAGIKVLMNQIGIGSGKIKIKIDRVFIAGGLGTCLQTDSTVDIGIIPGELKNKVVHVGNGAGIGAKMVLISRTCIEQARTIKDLVTHVDLSTLDCFQREFLNSMEF